MDELQEEHLGKTIISGSKIITYKKKSETSAFKQWVCRIAGPCPKFGFKREFVKGKLMNDSDDETLLKFKFLLENGNLYQYNNLYVAFGEYVSGFIAVNDEGNLLSIDKDGVRRLMGMPTKEWSKTKGKPKFTLEDKQRFKEKPNDESFANDDLPF